MKSTKIPFSIYGVPLLGIVGLLAAMWHPQVTVRPQASSPEVVFLATPNPRHDKIMAAFLRQEAKNVARCRARNQPAALAKTIADYNLIARECTPAVFQTTHLPSAL